MHPLSLFKRTNIVLLFHTVPSAAWFRKTLYTVKGLFKYVTAEEIESCVYNNRKLNNTCHICFDDGHRSVYEIAYPILKEMHIPASVFVSPKIVRNHSNYWFQELGDIRKHLDDTRLKEMICDIMGCCYEQIEKYHIMNIFKCLKFQDISAVIAHMKRKCKITINKKYNITLDQLFELDSSSLLTIGAHTVNHPILRNETNENVLKEIEDSIEDLSQILKKKIRYFAYPNGLEGCDYSERELMILKKNDIKMAFTTTMAFFDNHTEPFNIPRGGFSGYEESQMKVIAKLLLVPVWNKIELGTRVEKEEREAIMSLSIF